MKFLHTSDWHLGQKLLFHDRIDEHKQFFSWLYDVIISEKIELLIVSGDIFDNGTPPNYALKMYYNFLVKISRTDCRNVVIIGGNHDSIATLSAPKEILSILNVYVVAGYSGDINDEIIPIYSDSEELKCVICAVPFLRQRDVTGMTPGESYEEKSRNTMHGIKLHYEKVFEKAKELIKNSNNDIPIIATGHLFTSGGITSEGVRDIYVGNLEKFDCDNFPNEFSYIALGHLHKPQMVSRNKNIRYSGSPIPLSFSESSDIKKVIVGEILKSKEIVINPVSVPLFQKLLVISGTLESIKNELKNIKIQEKEIWIEVKYEGEEFIADLENIILDIISDKNIELFAVKNVNSKLSFLSCDNVNVDLENLTINEVFEKCVDLNKVSENDRVDLINLYNEITNEVLNRTKE